MNLRKIIGPPLGATYLAFTTYIAARSGADIGTVAVDSSQVKIYYTRIERMPYNNELKEILKEVQISKGKLVGGVIGGLVGGLFATGSLIIFRRDYRIWSSSSETSSRQDSSESSSPFVFDSSENSSQYEPPDYREAEENSGDRPGGYR